MLLVWMICSVLYSLLCTKYHGLNFYWNCCYRCGFSSCFVIFCVTLSYCLSSHSILMYCMEHLHDNLFCLWFLCWCDLFLTCCCYTYKEDNVGIVGFIYYIVSIEWNSHSGQLSLVIPPWLDTVSTGMVSAAVREEITRSV